MKKATPFIWPGASFCIFPGYSGPLSKSNIDVAKRILNPRLPIAPRIVRVNGTQKTDLCRVIFANSITLTPGTVSLDLDEEDIVVHALTEEAADDVQSGDMDSRVTALE